MAKTAALRGDISHLLCPIRALAREVTMAKITEGCSVCGHEFEMQFSYQMEETGAGFSFFCSHDCQAKHVRGEVTGGVHCDACSKHFVLDLVSQIVKSKQGRSYACSDACRQQLLAESQGVRLGAMHAPIAPSIVPPQIAAASSVVLAAARPSSAPPSTSVAPRSTSPSSPPARPSRSPAPVSAERVSEVTAIPPIYRGPKRIAVFNHKGGTGKTTTTVSLAAGLASRGLRVLLVDTDAQGNVGVSLNVKADKSLYHVLVMGLRPADVATTIRPNLDVIPSNETLAAAELYLAGRQNRDRVLRDRLAKVSDDYDVVLIDCSPSLSLMNQNALVFADAVLVPVACDFLSLVGVRQVVKTVKNVNALLHHPVAIWGVLPTFYDARARICRDAVETLRQHFGHRCLEPVRAATKLKEAPSVGKTIFEYASDSNAAEDYQRVVDALIAGEASAQSTVVQQKSA
jgi:chromosome partitioning protein